MFCIFASNITVILSVHETRYVHRKMIEDLGWDYRARNRNKLSGGATTFTIASVENNRAGIGG